MFLLSFSMSCSKSFQWFCRNLGKKYINFFTVRIIFLLICIFWLPCLNNVGSSKYSQLFAWCKSLLLSVLYPIKRCFKKLVVPDTAEDAMRGDECGFIRLWQLETHWGSIFLILTQPMSPFLANPSHLLAGFPTTILFHLGEARH